MKELKDFHCRRCKRVVAQSNDFNIFFETRPVPFNPIRIKFLCPFCRHPLEWKSTDENKACKTTSCGIISDNRADI